MRPVYIRAFKRSTARLLVAAQLALALQPLSALAQNKGIAPYNPQAKARQSPADRAGERLARAQELVKDLRQDKGDRDASRVLRRSQRLSELKAQVQEVEAGMADVRADLQATGAELRRKNLPAEILQRHAQAQADIEQRMGEYRQIAQRLNQAQPQSEDSAVQDLDAFFKRHPAGRRHTPIDPAKLPWGAPKATPRMPAETTTAWHQKLSRDHKIQLAQAGNLTTVGGVRFSYPPEPGQAPADADLAATADAQLTPAIRAKAAELGHNPLAIYNWLHNHIQWLPTWGSIQGADGTLQTLRGNAMDTASLGIALLRASGIPARYQFGTIDVPVEQVQNWVGGVSQPEAALNLLYQGGIAARGIASAGRIRTIRMEHVWISAYVNWTPGRGAKQGGNAPIPPVLAAHGQPQHPHPNAALNAWVPLDASYKQHEHRPGMNLQQAVPLDAAALLAAAQQGATVTPNYTQHLNQANLQTQLASYQNQIKAYIDSTPTGASSTIGDVLGSQTIKTRTFSLLPGTTANPVVVLGNQRAELPDDMRWKVSFQASGVDGASLLDRTFNLQDLLHKRVGTTYEGETPEDQAAIANYRIGGAATFPAYVLRVRPLFQIDGNTVATGAGTGMGKEVQWRVNILAAGPPTSGGYQQTYGTSAGDETVWAVVADAVSAPELQRMDFPATAAGNLHAVGMSYWHQVDAYAKLIAQRERAVALRMPSLGAISSGMRVQYIWGVARSAHYLGRTMDIGHSIIGVQGMNGATFQRELGLRTSYLEGNIFDQVFGRETGTGISAVRLLQTAQEAGQRVFTLNSGNADQYLGQIQMSATVREEVLDALLTGLEVTIPEFTQDLNGWQGTAYIAIRPETGAGVYIISGSLRGGDEGGDCELQPSTEPAKTTNFSPAVLFAAAIITMYLIASITPVIVVVGVSLLAVAASAVAAPAPQLKPPLDGIWHRLSGGRTWPTQFNWPPPYGTPALPHGSCTPEQHAALEAAKDAACDDPLAAEACKGNMSCELIQSKRTAIDACVKARVEVMDTCFAGGDANHWIAINDLLGRYRNCDKCFAFQQAQQCRRPAS